MTPNSSTTAFCTAVQFTTLYDWRPFGQFCSDTDVPPATQAAFQASAILAAKLQVASGKIEMAASRGQRYDPINDLAALAATSSPTNGGWALIAMTAGITAYEIVGRRFQAMTDYIKDSVEQSLTMLEALENGEMIFPFTEAQAAGIMNDYVEVTLDVEQRLMPSFYAQNLFGRRDNRMQ